MWEKTETETKFNKSKRIASNTAVLFIRMLIITIISLYTVRVVLNGLGAEDYGIFNTVAGVVTTSSFLSSVLAISVQRFYSFSMGKNNDKDLNEIFSSSINIIILLSLGIIIVFETFGLWFVKTQLTIPYGRMEATLWIYQFSLFSFIFTILEIPFTAAIFAHEDMSIYAVISTVDCFLRLTVAFLIGKFMADNLIIYGSGLLIVSFIIFQFYAIYGLIKYEECHYKKTHNTLLYKKLLSFSGWTLFGSAASTGMQQGNIILLNIFFGPIINAAFGIALQINNAFNALSNSIILPLRPAMIKAYAEKNNDYLNQLFSVGNKFILYFLLAIGIPIFSEIVTILTWWLGNINSDIIIFSRLIIIYIIFLGIHSPITTIMQATGHVKEYHLPVESITLMCIPLTWLFLVLDFQLTAFLYQ
jgi:O-antigen/teichoic acid export membrane protein